MKAKLAILPLAGLMVAGAAGAVLAQSGGTASDTGAIVLQADESASPSADTRRAGDGVLDDVLADLVTKGTITQAQSDAITDAVDAERDARRAEHEAQRELMQSILEDGQITEDELAQLPEDSPLRSIDGILDDGVITSDELRGLRGLGFGGGRGHHGGGPMGAPPADDPATSS